MTAYRKVCKHSEICTVYKLVPSVQKLKVHVTMHGVHTCDYEWMLYTYQLGMTSYV